MRPLSGDDPVQIGRYRLRSRLGAGGMGRVYLAFTPAGRPVALKVVRPELSHDQEFRARFHQEIQAAQRVRGLYTAELVDADPDADPPWLATAYVQGPSLQQVVDERGPMTEAEAFQLIAGVAEALQAIHSVNVVHRDLKPSNVVLGPDGPRVIDFGIARALEGAALTQTGMAVGTPQFMAPEQLLGLAVTPMIDIFALGTLAAYSVLGRSPFGEGHPPAVYYRVLHEPPDLNGCPPQLRVLIEQCLAKEPAGRPRLDQILRFCLARSDVAGSLSPPAQSLYPPVEMAVHRHEAPLPTMVTGVAPQSPTLGAPGRVVPPQPIIKAVRLIYLGGLISACSVVIAVLTAAPAMRTAMHMSGSVDGVTAVNAGLTGVLGACTWFWMARQVKRGWGKARFTAASLFAIRTILIYSTNAGGISNHLSFVFELAEWGVGLLTLVALWDGQSSAYFAALNRARSLALPEWPSKATPQASGPRHGKN
jgi:hypothetical protein